MENQVCPSCHTEIVWDPEFGPEEICPHCYNPLQEYRSVKIPMDGGPAEYAAGAHQHPSKGEGNDTEWEGLDDEDESDDELNALEDWNDGDNDLQGYEEAVERMLDEQEDGIQCERCHEYMLLAGHQVVGANAFKPHVYAAVERSFVQAPFTVKMYVCPACFQVSQQVSEEDRMKTVQQFL
ncbi:hypothetical protein [Paenibacillus swuensis]|uniref:hypothetical protein n=1 Tax=Paenibacillus swuensis TaxID=1178515 RepID=UPI000838C950|nr:hypothetical protein [Paenibacillus swuensis]